MKDSPLIKAFNNYVQLFNQLQWELQHTPSWRIIRTQALLNRVHRTNVAYSKWFEAWLRENSTEDTIKGKPNRQHGSR